MTQRRRRDCTAASKQSSTISSEVVKVFPVWRANLPSSLLGAAHSACYSMAFSNALAKNGTPPESLQVTAAVTFEPGTGITGSHLLVSAKIAGISEDDFQRLAAEAKAGCPVSQALAGIPITLEASLA